MIESAERRGGWPGRAARAAAIAAGLFLAACAPAPLPDDPAPGPSRRAGTSFQSALDAAGAGLTLPAEGKVILINLPSFELVAIEDGVPAFWSRVIVGKPATPTPVLDLTTVRVRFRPAWRPTPGMIANGDYADRVWPPGPDNPLGLAAIELSPNLLVYIHDTNQPQLFERSRRAFSYGCIRVERWDELMAWTLDMPLAEVHALAFGEGTRDVATPPIPVLIRHLTRFPSPFGRPTEHAALYPRAAAAPAAFAPPGMIVDGP